MRSPGEGRIHWLAAALEMVPFVALLVLLGSIEAGSAVLLVLAIFVSLLSGIGWLMIGRPKAAVTIALARGIVFVYALGWGITEQVNEFYGSTSEGSVGATGQMFIDIAMLFFLLSTIASALAVAIVSRIAPTQPAATPAPDPSANPAL